jgi:D-alanine-D-alanine ligase-like ATP-grasp enzyme/acylphosphatase/Flp pilus assembly protein TadD
MHTEAKITGKPSNNELLIQSIIAKGANCYPDSPFLHAKRDLEIELIVDRAKKKGMDVVFHTKMVYELIGYGKSVVFFQNAPENSKVATVLTSDKSLTKRVLSQKELPVPQGGIFKQYEEAVRYFSGRVTPQVVKPNIGTHGSGVTAKITEVPEFEKAWLLAHQGEKPVIVEDFITGDDLRVYVMGGKARAAYVRVPAHVTGTGIDSIQKLVEEKNKHRSQNPRLKKSLINRFDLLEANGLGLDYVPAAGEKVQLTSVANISAGGDSVEIFGSIHISILEIAERSARAIPGLNIAGIDLIVPDFTRPPSSENRVMVLEINKNPAIVSSVFPMYGKPVDLPDMMIDFMLKDEKIGRKIVTRNFPEYIRSSGGTAFSRNNHKTQVDIIKQAGYKKNLLISEISKSIFTLTGENQEVTFYAGMPHRTSSMSRTASNKKDWTKRLLKAHGVIVPQGESFTADDRDNAWRFAEKLGRPVVVKPQTGSGGSGVSVNISTPDHFNLAWGLACNTNNKIILVEEYFPANDYRLFVVGDQVPAAAQRIPAYLVGDGIHAVQKLIDKKNHQRLSNPYLGAKLIKITAMINFNLTQQGITAATVLKKGQYLQLHSVANIGSGGESVDVSEVMHPGFVDIAVRARKALFEPVHAGIDVLAEDIAKSPDEQDWMVIEVNVNPDIALHHFPASGTARDVAGALVSHLFPEISTDQIMSKIMIKVLIKGKVQGVGFRKWIWRNAHLHAISGWVQNNPDGTLESVFHGAPNAVDHMISICRKGPKRAAVVEITVLSFEGDVSSGFVINKTADRSISATPSDIASTLVSHLSPEISNVSTASKKLIKILIKGKVQGVGFRKWIWRNAHLHAISGWVQNNPDGTLESVFHGAPNAVDHMISICRKGPKRAAVEEITLLPFEGDVSSGFVINKTADRSMEIMKSERIDTGKNTAQGLNNIQKKQQGLVRKPTNTGSPVSGSVRNILDQAKKNLSLMQLEEAEMAAKRVLELNPNNIEAIICLGRSLLKQKRTNEALGPLSLGSELAPKNPSVLSIYASCLRRLKRLDEAIFYYRKALSIKADYRDGLLGLSVALRLAGQEKESRLIARRAITMMPFSIRASTDPKAPIVLVIKALANLHFRERKTGYAISGGHNTAAALLDSDVTRVIAYVDNFRPEAAWLKEIPKPSVIFNVMSDADKLEPQAWELAQNLVNYFNVPVINMPKAVRHTTRNGVYDAIHDVEGLVMPKTCRVTVKMADDLGSGIDAAGLRYPLIVRPTGTQTGKGMVVYKSVEDLKNRSEHHHPGDYYAAEFFNFQSADGFWRKTRIFCIGGKLLAEHHVAAEDWNIHATNARILMSQERFINDEIDFIKNFEVRMGAIRMAALRELASRVGLDYFGVDCSLLPDNRLLIFEVNASMQFKSVSQEERAFLLENRKNIASAFKLLVQQKIGKP